MVKIQAFESLIRFMYDWSQEEISLEDVKKLATESPILRYYDPDKELQVQCDASQGGLGCEECQ